MLAVEPANSLSERFHSSDSRDPEQLGGVSQQQRGKRPKSPARRNKRAAPPLVPDEFNLKGEVCVGLRLYSLQVEQHSRSTFTAQFRIFYEWCDEELAASLMATKSQTDSWDQHIPEVRFLNQVECAAEAWTRAPRVIDHSTGRMYIHRRYSGVFVQRQECGLFPFDTQKIQLSLQLGKKPFRGTHSLRLLPLEFRGVPSIEGYQLLRPPLEAQRRAGGDKPELTVTFEVSRESGFYVRNLLTWLVLISSLAFIGFLLPLRALEERGAFILSIIFTNLALRFSLGTAIPQVPHSTLLDLYQNSCIAMLVLMAFAQAAIGGVVPSVLEGESFALLVTLPELLRGNLSAAAAMGTAASRSLTAQESFLLHIVDLLAALAFIAGWLVFNVGYFGYVWTIRRHAKRCELTPRGHDRLIDWTTRWKAADRRPARPPSMQLRQLRSQSSSLDSVAYNEPAQSPVPVDATSRKPDASRAPLAAMVASHGDAAGYGMDGPPSVPPATTYRL